MKAPDDNKRNQEDKLPADAFEGMAKVIPLHPDIPLPFLTTEKLPPFPLETLPPAVRAFVSQLADSLEVPVDLPAVLALGALASAVQGKYEVSPRRDWFETVNLYLALALDSGERKSPVFRRVLAPLRAREKELRKAWKEQKEEAGKRAEEAGGRGEKLSKGEKGEKTEPPYPRLLMDDTTPEQAARVMAEQGERITLASDEGTIFAHMIGMYAKTPNNGLWLKAHDGGTYTIDRRSGPPVLLEQPLLTLILAVQPSVIRSLAGKPELRGQGLWARFAYVFPKSRVGKRSFDTQPVDPQAEDAYRELVLELARRNFAPPDQETIVVRFSGAAWAQLQAALVKIDRQMGIGGPLAGIKDWASKYGGLVVRFAGILHAADHEHPGSAEVSEAAVDRALALGRYFLAHAQHALEVEMTADPAEQEAHRLLEVIRRKGWTDFRLRDVQRATAWLRDKGKAQAAVDHLVDRGFLTEVPRPMGQRAGAYRLVATLDPSP